MIKKSYLLHKWHKELHPLIQTFLKKYKINVMTKYSKGAAKKVEKTMHEMKEGKLKTGTGKR